MLEQHFTVVAASGGATYIQLASLLAGPVFPNLGVWPLQLIGEERRKYRRYWNENTWEVWRWNICLENSETSETWHERHTDLTKDVREQQKAKPHRALKHHLWHKAPPTAGWMTSRHSCYSVLLFPTRFFTGRGVKHGIISTASQLRELTDSGCFGKLSCRIAVVYWNLTHSQEVVLLDFIWDEVLPFKLF